MPRGFPDDNQQSNPLGQTVVDNAELAARLGAKTTIQRSGQVIYSTDFRDGMAEWGTSVVGAATVNLLANRGIISQECVRLYAGVLAGEIASMTKRMPIIDAPSAAIEFYFDMAMDGLTHAGALRFLLEIDWHQKKYEFSGLLVGNTNNLELDYEDAGGAPHVLTIHLPMVLKENSIPPYWHYVKLTVNPENERYKSIIIDDVAYDLTPYFHHGKGLTFPGQISATYSYTYTGTTAYIYIGSTVITINEP